MQVASKHLDELEWTGWPPDQVALRGKAEWKELLGSHSGCQNDMTMGVVRLRTGESLEPHRHAQPETYFTLSGRGTVTIQDVVHQVEPGRMLFIPGNARHCMCLRSVISARSSTISKRALNILSAENTAGPSRKRT
jgi:mannose-6-phosphate isomerase-like protein (cupin superfamily)